MQIHVLWIKPMPGVADQARLVVAADTVNQTSVVVLLPDDSQIIVTADRAVYIRGGQMITLSKWQFAPTEVAEKPAPEIPADVPRMRPRRNPAHGPVRSPTRVSGTQRRTL